jgi:hypothetical protein
MALTVGELNAILTVDDKNFSSALKEAKKTLERAADSADEFGDETKQAFGKGTKAADKFEKEVSKGRKEIQKATTPMENFGKKIGTAFKVGAVIAVGKALADLTMEMANLALEAEESAAAFEITFGGATQEVTRFVNQMAHAFGMTRAEMQQQMAVTGSIIQGMGFTSDAAAEMSVNIMNLSGDLAAFMNIQEGAVIPAQAITKALTGEREMLKSMGIVLRQVEIEQKAMNMTGKEAVKELTDQEKAAASLMLVEEKMGHIKGQLSREMQGAANQMRSLKAEFKEAKTEVGQALLPAFAELIPVVRSMMPAFKEVASTVANLVETFVRALEPALSTLMVLISALMPIFDVLIAIMGVQLKAVLEVIGAILENTLIPILEALGFVITLVANNFGIMTTAQEAELRSAETLEGVIFRLNEAIAAGIPKQDAMNAAMAEAAGLGIDESEALDAATDAAYGFSDAKRAETEALIASKRVLKENIQAGNSAAYNSYIQADAVKELDDEIVQLEQDLIAQSYAQYAYARSQDEFVNGTYDSAEAIEEEADEIRKNTLVVQQNTQAKLDALSIQNEAVTALMNLVTAVTNANEIVKRQQVEEDKLNELYRERAKIMEIVNAERGVGEQQTEVELAQIAALRKQEEMLLTQQQKGLDLKLEIAVAELDVADAIHTKNEMGDEATAREDLAIKQAELRLRTLKNEQATSKDVTLELANVQKNLASAVATSTQATQAYISAEQARQKIDAAIGKQRTAFNEAEIDTTEEQLELASARLAVQSAMAFAEDRGVSSEARKALAETLGITDAGVSKIFKDLGITDTFMQAQLNMQTFKQFERQNAGGNNSGSGDDSSGAGDRPPETGIDKIGGSGGAFLNRPTVQTDSGINLTTTENLALSSAAKNILPMLDSFDQSALRSSAVNQFLGGNSTPNVIVNIDPSLDAEARIDKQLADINDRLQNGNRFRVL